MRLVQPQSKVSPIQWQWISAGLIRAVWIFCEASHFWHKLNLWNSAKQTRTKVTRDRICNISVVVYAVLCYCYGFQESLTPIDQRRGDFSLSHKTSQKVFNVVFCNDIPEDSRNWAPVRYFSEFISYLGVPEIIGTDFYRIIVIFWSYSKVSESDLLKHVEI